MTDSENKSNNELVKENKTLRQENKRLSNVISNLNFSKNGTAIMSEDVAAVIQAND